MKNTEYNIINLGAGVQSSTMALMAATGVIKPMPDAAIFADTQAEPQIVYDWLSYITPLLPFPIHVVSKGDLTEESLKIRTRRDNGKTYIKRLIPLFGTGDESENMAMLMRACTADYKINPIMKKVKEIAGIKRRKPGQVHKVSVTQWIGISHDEMQRMKDPRSEHGFTQHRWPLIEMKMTRQDCFEWMLVNGYPEPPRSACYYCAFHSNDEWRNLRDKHPEERKKAIEFDNKLRQLNHEHTATKMRMKNVFLHSDRIPLDEVDLGGDTGNDFQSECEGMCGL